MRKRKLLFTLLALASGAFLGGSGAMAQVSSWESVYEQTQTTSDSWTALTSSTASAGMTLGATGTTSYYYAKETLNLSNSTAGGSGLVIKGTVYLYIPYGVHLTCVGGNASGTTGAGAGIELATGNTLYIIGSGDGSTTVTATGGNAANGSKGGDGTDATGNSSWLKTGTGGDGGVGGGGAGAGIGTRGGAGGSGGSGGSGYQHDWNAYNGTAGSAGGAGSTAGAMGNLYVDNTYGIKVVATGGNAGSSGGAGGGRGKGYIWDGGNNYTVAGGGGGGAGGFGGAAANIGTGGPGGGGGGGGAGGAQDWAGSQLYDVTAYGGNGGTNADGTSAANGAEANTTRTAYENNLVVSENSDYTWQWDDWNPASGSCTMGNGGAGGGKGNNASNGTQNFGTKTYNITFTPVKTNINGKTGSTLNSKTVTYSPSTSTNLVFPKNKDGYNWALLVYGKDCRATGSASIFTTATTTFFGGNYDDESLRTEVLKDVYGDMEFIEVAATCKLENTGNNLETLTDFYYNEAIASQKYPITVRLKNRTLYRDNHWNTICLPFAMTPSQIDLSILQGATIYEMNTTNTGYYPDGQNIPLPMYRKDGPVLFFQFDIVNYTSTGLEAGKPYLVKWGTTAPTTDGNYVDNTSNGNSRHEMDFYNVTVTKLAPSAPYGNGVTFQGTFSSSETLQAGDKSKLVFGPDDKLYYPSKNMSVGSCRAYFIIPSLASANASEIILNFGDEETTSIQTINFSGKNQDDAPVYNLNGQRLSAPQKGVNIINGRKVMIK